jgi:ADP-heptose:LPS heptosyltransferase
MKILIIRFSSIGDIVLTTPVIRSVKQQIPNVQLHYATKQSFENILEHNPYIDKLFLLQNNNEKKLIEELVKEQYDAIIDLHHNIRTLKIKRAFKGVPAYSYNKLNIEKWLYTALKINKLPKVHIVDRYMNTVKELDVVNDGKGLDYFIPVKDEVPLHDIPTSHQLGYIALVVGAALATKQMPLNKLVELCNAIQYPIILIGGKEDMVLGNAIEISVNDLKIYNACGKFNLHESAFLVKNCKLVITHDTGLMHIAAAFKKPIISVWGNTVPQFGMYPYFGNTTVPHFVNEVSNLHCRPCSKIGFSTCPKKHFKCMENQNVAAIKEQVNSLLPTH